MKKKKYRITVAFKVFILQLLLCSSSMLLGYTWRVYSENKKWDNLIYPGTRIANLDLGSKSKKEAMNIIKSTYIEPMLKKRINIISNNKSYVMECSKLILKCDIDSIVGKAFDYGKGLDLYKKNRIIKEGTDKSYHIEFDYNKKYLKDSIEIIEKNTRKEPINANIHIVSDGKYKVNNDLKGYKLNKEKLEEYIISEIKGKSVKDINIQAPINEISAPITAKVLATINTNISSYNTSFVTSSFARENNICLATKSINGKILIPGETFSFNDCVGQRTKERGFMEAPVIINDKVEPGVGGGICQVSSTLYNAVLRARLEIVERKKHSITASYVPLGMDATVNWNNIDFKFKNNLHYPVVLEAYTKNKKIYINIYSNSSLGKKTYFIANDADKKIPTNNKIINYNSSNNGQTVAIENGR